MWSFKHGDIYGKLPRVSMSNLLLLPLTILIGFFVYMFLFWRRLREDYLSDVIFGSGFVVFFAALFGGGAVYLLSTRLSAYGVFDVGEVWFWGAFLGFVTTVFVITKRGSAKFFEIFEAAGVGLLPLYSALMIVLSLMESSIINLAFGIFILNIFAFFYFLEGRYKRFSWYKSGKVGFSGLVSLGVLFLVRAVVAAAIPGVISLAGEVEIVFSGVASFLMFFAVYTLAET